MEEGKKDTIHQNLKDIIKKNYEVKTLKLVYYQKIKKDNLSSILDQLDVPVVNTDNKKNLYRTKLDSDCGNNQATFNANRRLVTKVLVAGDTKFNKLIYDSCECSGISKKRLKFV